MEHSINIVKALTRNAIYFYEFDVTTGIVEHDIIGKNGKNFSSMMGFHAPYSFDEATAAYMEGKVKLRYVSSSEGKGIITRNVLLDAYHSGKTVVDMLVFSTIQERFYKLTYYLWESTADEHIKALSVCEDVSDKISGNELAIMQETSKRLEEEILENEIISSIGKQYFAMYRIDVEHDFFEEISSDSSVHKLTGKKGKAQATLNRNMPKISKPEYWGRILEFCNLKTLSYRLSNQEILDIEYPSMDDRWHRASIISQKRNEEGKVTHILFLIQLISKENQIKLERERRQLIELNQSLQEQVHIVGGLSNAYFAVYLVDLQNRFFTIVKEIPILKHLTKNYTSITKAFQNILPVMVADKDVVKMLKFTDQNTLQDRLMDKEYLFAEFQGTVPEWEWCRASWIVSERDREGKVIRVLFAIEDIKDIALERQQQEEERDRLHKMEQMHMEIISKALQGGFKVSKCDRQSTIIMVSDQLVKMLGYQSREDLLGTAQGTMYGLIHDRDISRLQNDMSLFLKSKEEGQMYTLNYRIKCADRNWKNVEDKGQIVPSSSGGYEYWSLVVDQDELIRKTKDLQEAREANRKLKDTQELLQRNLNIIGSLSQNYLGIYYIDLTNYTYQEIGSNYITEIKDRVGASGNAIMAFHDIVQFNVLPESKKDFTDFADIRTLSERLSDRNSISCQFVGKNIGWTEGYFIAVDRDEKGKCTHVIWAFRSINEEKEKDYRLQKELKLAKEEAEEANKVKTTFLLNMSHDIRTPMNAILGYSQMVKKSLTDPVLIEYLHKMEQSSQFLLSLINNVLDMARIESGKMELDNEYLEIGNLVPQILDTFEVDAKKKYIDFTYFSDVEHKHILCDRLKLQQVFINLLSNSIKYTTQGGRISVKIEEIPCEIEGIAMIKSTIEDNGIGMSEDFLPHLFDRFSRERTTTTGKIHGTGLGMPIVKDYVELMGGTIHVASKLGKGTRFTLHIPHKIVDDPSPEQANKKDEHVGDEIDRLKGKHILLVEDNELNAEIAKAILEDMGLMVDRVEDGILCVEKIEHTPPATYDLILMDIQMPNMDGYKATKIIRNLSDENKANIPIIAMTANAFEEDKRKALSIGMNGHLAKPINISEMTKALAEILG